MKILYIIYLVSVIINLIFFTYDMKNLIKSCPYKYSNIAVPLSSFIFSLIPIFNTMAVFSFLDLLYRHNKLLSEEIKWNK